MIPTTRNFYQHRYGGIYMVNIISAKSTVDKSNWVVYEHIYPFEQGVWIRPYEEFTDGRFREIEDEEYYILIAKDRSEFQAEITAAKLAAKG